MDREMLVEALKRAGLPVPSRSARMPPMPRVPRPPTADPQDPYWVQDQMAMTGPDMRPNPRFRGGLIPGADIESEEEFERKRIERLKSDAFLGAQQSHEYGMRPGIPYPGLGMTGPAPPSRDQMSAFPSSRDRVLQSLMRNPDFFTRNE